MTTEASVVTAKPDETERLVATMTLAFAADPLTRWFFPDAKVYLEHFPGFVMAFGGAAFEHGTAYGANEFGGAALWMPEGVSSDQEALGTVMVQALSPERLAELGPFGEQLEHYHTKDPHWYLPMIGVQPTCQGQGLGSALLQHALKQVDEQGLAAYLESSRPENVPLYQRHGFEVIGEIQVGTSPTLFPMLRPAR